MKVHVRMGDDHKSFIGLLLVVGIFVVLWWFTTHSRPVTNLPTPTPHLNTTVVAYGDSLISGFGLLRSEQAFIHRLEETLETNIITLGQDRRTVANAWRNLEQITSLKPRIVILSIGTQDALVQNTSENDFEIRLERIVDALHSSGSAVILLETPGYTRAHRSVAREHKAMLVPHLMSDISGSSRYMLDEIHPNSEGHALIAQRVLPYLKKALSQ